MCIVRRIFYLFSVLSVVLLFSCKLSHHYDGVRFQVTKQDGKSFRPVNEEQTNAALEILNNAEFKITSREDKPTQTRPTAPYITSTLQQAASTRLGYGVKKTMIMAQRFGS